MATNALPLIVYTPKKGPATLVSVYAHTLYADEQIKDVFYSRLNLIVKNYPNMTSLSFQVTSM